MNNVDNCPKCGKIFIKALRSICNDCAKDYEKMFEKVYSFIRKRENRMASLEDVVEGTGVQEEYIFQYVREGRLKLSQFPNLAYPCESCGKMTRSGRICSTCKGSIDRDLKGLEAEKSVKERQKAQENAKYSAYTTLNDRLDK